MATLNKDIREAKINKVLIGLFILVATVGPSVVNML
ncbi:gp004 [Erwinia phage vB_EamP-S6]|uniref:Gp004 n=1 Tax=Erwinia phage vB_EamP-S6 TaxID=1051675 RepID=G0YQ96_9CAUD|nr:gp004 [Erwinia phage vB_EamP-S6]AEJ81523.1 gp004 [Erwinia phage vB_EamP-S6]